MVFLIVELMKTLGTSSHGQGDTPVHFILSENCSPQNTKFRAANLLFLWNFGAILEHP